MASQEDYMKDPLQSIRSGYLGPGLDPEAIYGQFRQMLEQGARGGAGYLSRAAGAAGGVPRGLESRLGAIGAGQDRQAATQIATAVSNFERSRYESAMDRYYQYWRDQQAMESQEQGMFGSLFGGLAGGIMNMITLGQLGKSGMSTADKSAANILASQ